MEKGLDNFIRLAKESGVAKDQLINFIHTGYIPLKWQLKFHAIARQADKEGGPVDIGVGGARGPGKALSVDTPIPTTSGWTTMGNICTGDIIFGMDGKKTVVTNVFDVMNERKCYDVCFSDGSLITADEAHLWITFTKEERRAFIKRTEEYRKARCAKRGKKSNGRLVGKNTKERPIYGVRTTKEIFETIRSGNEINHSVPTSLPIDLEERRLPIHPYLLGVWLGDGHKDGGKITCFDEQIIEDIKDNGHNVRPMKAEGLWIVDGMTTLLRENGLRMNKHIPVAYLRSSIEQRIVFLQGLNDTDGYVDKDGSVEFTNTNKKIIDGYYELVCSLGIKATVKEGNAMLYGRIISKKWRIRYTTSIPAFRLRRKLEKQNKKGTDITRRRFIVSVEPRESVPVRCITVDNESKTYLAGKSFIPTHNSHCTFAQLTLDDCQRIPNLKALFLRQTGKSADESFQDLIDSVLKQRVAYQYNASKGILRFNNGAKVILGGFENENDIDKYVGIQYDVIVIEERNQLTGEKILKLKGSLRTVKPNWRARMYSSFNPGNIGHADVKKTFVLPYAATQEVLTRFIPSTYKDNPFLKQEYIDYLLGLEGALGKAWRDGNFDTFEGQYFIEWDREKHTVAPFLIPPTWKRFRSYDYGHENPATCAWYALDYDGRIWVYREKYWQKGHKQDADKQAQEIAKMSEGEQYEYSVADPAIFSPTGMVDKYGGQTIAETFVRNGITFIPASNRRVDGWSLLHKYLFWDKNNEPKIKYFNTCYDSIRTIPELIHDTHRPEDVDSKGEDHCFVGDTLVDTFNGQKKIKDLVGQEVYVNTMRGFQKCRSVRKTRKTEVWKMELHGGKEIIATPDHRFLTQMGWKQMQDIDIRYDVVIQSDICITSYLILFKSLAVSGIIFAADIFKKTVKDCILLSGSGIMEKYQKDFTFIIKMAIKKIIQYPILSLNQDMNIFLTTQAPKNISGEAESILKNLPGQKQLNGINLRQEENGTVNNQRRRLKNGNGLKKFVQYAVEIIKHLNSFLIGRNIAISIAKCAPYGVEEVYDLTVPHIEHFTIEEGIVVHNCADRDRYLLLTLHEAKTVKPLSDTQRKMEQLKNLKLENVNPSVLNDFYQGDFYRNSYGK